MKRTAWQGMQVVLGVSLLCLGAAHGWADMGSDGDKAELQVLRDRLDKLENKIASQEAAAAGAEPGNAVIQLPSGFNGVQMSGFVDTTYTYNFDTPETTTNTLRVFDTQANGFMINNAELVVDKPVSAESPVGFKTSLMFGTDAEVVGGVTTGLGANAHTHGNGSNSAASDEVELKDAYVEYLAPIGNGLDLKAGKFATMHGAEVIESKDNWNISRSILFGFAIPFTHTGLRATYPVAEWLSATLGVDNGWDLVDDNNQARTVGTSFTVTPMTGASLTANYMFGADQAGDNHHGRHLVDLVLGWQPIEPLQLKLNYDYAVEDDAAALHNNAVWQGLAGYARYALTDKLAVSLRGEFFNDADGVRTAIATGINGIVDDDVKLYEMTLTGEYQINPHLLGRLEFRHDKANAGIYRHQDIGQVSYQDTVALEFITPF